MDPLTALGVLEMLVGRVTRCEPNPEARKPAYRLWIDLGPRGTKTSSAQVTDLYAPTDLVGRLVVVAANLGTKKVAGFPSEVLLLGVTDPAGRVVLLQPEREAPLGARVH